MNRVAAAILLAGSLFVPAGAAERISYKTGSDTCDGFPKASIGMAPGFCAGIIVAPPADFGARAIRMPRVLLALPGAADFLVTDVGRWDGPGG